MAKMTIEQIEHFKNNPNIILYLNGSKESFKCPVCNSNVFQHYSNDTELYTCNGCRARYSSKDKKEEQTNVQ